MRITFQPLVRGRRLTRRSRALLLVILASQKEAWILDLVLWLGQTCPEDYFSSEIF